MATEITVPALGESVSEATVAKWLKKEGDAVAADEPLVELETDKVTVEVNAPEAGALSEIVAAEGAEVEVGALLGRIEAGASGAKAAPKAGSKPEPKGDKKAESKPDPKAEPKEKAQPAASGGTANLDHPLSPAVRRLVEERSLDPSAIPATGKDGRLTKDDVVTFLERGQPAKAAEPAKKAPAAAKAPRADDPREERVPMSRLRRRIAERLKEAQNNAAMLTTFNEVDMTAILKVREQYKDAFEKKHGVRLGFMSFFIKAAVVALREVPAVNAEIDGTDIVYKNYYDIGVAVGGPQGLVVPVVRDCDTKSFAEIEADIAGYGKKARDGSLTMEEMTGGTFTISNGGVYGSLMSTPILNPPQSAILGMHKTQQRPMVMPDGSIQARPMMYLAMSYDHRIIDGKEAVTSLVRMKECLEDPQRILLDM
ncbi:2-oxoglutarate dehydrogenase complex dihydrolipoyllysine-residue succinyltransferase [Roseospira marina]|uniref:Dihydrolipoyllysine-residue succinyltransferase component of 2-oxoglutarate dehydrogenase complex n=1 Tax=Roseospira marina TaxID=140057 RepID=A0A5M6IEK1_9PROT|nr:2-oxoglutarate dehydrogenase complex dihydrolipoyllysine-residue succinyltransferase [Roseospira marina]KAA5606542.1 2-oxoglutarate dehydrogenase complex dihydrolipoyllysine-residue succinyltransferase [Roseospira marina]MBB4314029.1 2-oxoglutarate dehydrogenase E2 component (dihydrolipoamide succinyltransferase) [Roseospira marina]MBB5087190.1 2-oxoglutarate dehydrogenase E2 component (dihydrolipoamide succinyltransferase) [Roseospira marina]